MVSHYSDEVLFSEFKRRRQRAFSALYDRFYLKLYSFCIKKTKDQHEAKDITLTALNKMFERYDKYNSLEEAERELFVIARNLCIDFLRKQTTKQNYLSVVEDPQAQELDLVNRIINADYLAQVKKLIGKLPARQRQAVELVIFNQLKYKEAADQMKVQPKQVEKLFSRGLKTVRQWTSPDKAADALLVVLSLLVFQKYFF